MPGGGGAGAGGGGPTPPGGQQGGGAAGGQQGGALATAAFLWQHEVQPAASSIADRTNPVPRMRSDIGTLLWPRRARRPEPTAGSQGDPKAGRPGLPARKRGAQAPGSDSVDSVSRDLIPR